MTEKFYGSLFNVVYPNGPTEPHLSPGLSRLYNFLRIACQNYGLDVDTAKGENLLLPWEEWANPQTGRHNLIPEDTLQKIMENPDLLERVLSWRMPESQT